MEVLAANRVQRDAIAKAFAEYLLKLQIEVKKMPLHQFDLTPLLDNHPLTWDAEDGIESVRVLMIKMIDRVNGSRVTVEVPALQATDFHEFVQDRFKDNNPFRSRRFTPAQAKIAIRFKSENGSPRFKMLPIQIKVQKGYEYQGAQKKSWLGSFGSGYDTFGLILTGQPWGGDWQEVQAITFTSPVAPMEIAFSCVYIRGQTGVPGGAVRFRLVYDNTVLLTSPNVYQSETERSTGPVVFTFSHTPGSGTRRYGVEMIKSAGDISVVSHRHLRALGLKDNG